MENTRRRARLPMWGKKVTEQKRIRPIENVEPPPAYETLAQTLQRNERTIDMNRLVEQPDLEKWRTTSRNQDNKDDIIVTATSTRRISNDGYRKQNERLTANAFLDANHARPPYRSNEKQLTSTTVASNRDITLRSLLDSSSKPADRSANKDIMQQLNNWTESQFLNEKTTAEDLQKLLQTPCSSNDKSHLEGRRQSPEEEHCSSCPTLQGALTAALSRNKLLEELVSVLQLEALHADERATSSEQSVHHLITDMCLLQKENEVLKRRLDALMLRNNPSPEQPALKLPTVLWREITLE